MYGMKSWFSFFLHISHGSFIKSIDKLIPFLNFSKCFLTIFFLSLFSKQQCCFCLCFFLKLHSPYQFYIKWGHSNYFLFYLLVFFDIYMSFFFLLINSNWRIIIILWWILPYINMNHPRPFIIISVLNE